MPTCSVNTGSNVKPQMTNPEKQFSRSAIAIDFTQNSDVAKVLPSVPLLSSQSHQRHGIHLGYYHHPASEIPEVISNQHLILVHLKNPTQAEQKIGTQVKRDQFQVGDIVIIPADIPHRAKWNAENQYLLLSIDPDVWADAVQPGRNSLELIPHFATADPLIHGIGLALKSEIELSGSENSLYADTLKLTLFTHLLQRYTAQDSAAYKPITTGKTQTTFYGLPAYRLRQVIDYVDAHLERNLKLSELSAIAQLSPNYFTQRFKQSTGLTPHQYVIQQRVEKAKRLLLSGKLSIAEVAVAVGFSHQSHLNRHFKRQVGTTPKAFLRHQ